MDRELLRCRAWIEVNLCELDHNLADIRSHIAEGCEIIAVVKADAYGHGMTPVALRLNEKGVNFFAVACLTEAIELREVLPNANILILGYTSHKYAKYLSDNNLIQSVFELEHAQALNDSGYKLRIHIAIDSGMRRYGFDYAKLSVIENVFKCENLKIEATATHFSVADSLEKSDIEFTIKQMNRFDEAVAALKERGCDVGKLHAQSSYAIYNHPEMKYDYVRPGIMLYGVQSISDETEIRTNLNPLLSVKAVISQVRWIEAGESVSYGRLYTADKPMKLASVAIGYADGIPRQMTGNGGMCIVNGCKVPIVGRICMDSLMIDATNIDDIKTGDTATLIGRDGDEVIHSEDVAAICGTITNDILSRFSKRLPKIFTE